MGVWTDYAMDRAHDAGTILRWGTFHDGKPWMSSDLRPSVRYEGATLDSAAFALVQHEWPPPDAPPAA